MSEMDERMDSFEKRLESVGSEVGNLRSEVGGLRGEVGGLRSEVGGLRGEVGGLRGEVGDLREDVHKLRVVVEEHDGRLKLIAEVQVDHGRQLDEHGRMLREISEQVAPLKDLRDFVARVASDHEQRITALEGHTGPQAG